VARLARSGSSGPRATARSSRAQLAAPALRGVVFDHVDFPGPRLNDLIAVWREHAAVVLVARSEVTLGRLHHQLYDSVVVTLAGLRPAQGRELVALARGKLDLPVWPGSYVDRLLLLTEGNPGLLWSALRHASRRREDLLPPERLVLEARLQAIAREREVFFRSRARARLRASKLPR